MLAAYLAGQLPNIAGPPLLAADNNCQRHLDATARCCKEPRFVLILGFSAP